MEYSLLNALIAPIIVWILKSVRTVPLVVNISVLRYECLSIVKSQLELLYAILILYVFKRPCGFQSRLGVVSDYLCATSYSDTGESLFDHVHFEVALDGQVEGLRWQSS